MDEEQWKWLLKKKLNRPDLVALTKVYRTYQPAIVTLNARIATTDALINHIVYQLYDLTSEEIALVEQEAS